MKVAMNDILTVKVLEGFQDGPWEVCLQIQPKNLFLLDKALQGCWVVFSHYDDPLCWLLSKENVIICAEKSRKSSYHVGFCRFLHRYRDLGVLISRESGTCQEFEPNWALMGVHCFHKTRPESSKRRKCSMQDRPCPTSWGFSFSWNLYTTYRV